MALPPCGIISYSIPFSPAPLQHTLEERDFLKKMLAIFEKLCYYIIRCFIKLS
ncbi:hypothetical protein HMPREF0239_02641 [Clostridium sp. ATCC BAA-442]|uniref:Uncharacterized protein n=1 Tax=Flavonifractor plautii ATCC 29863 TaxID=411475 RepID=G9YX57_FLAPL|nr:hypothetical protein HMPREF0372_04125 [Flavonifractor plautii ATCC 29863]ERI75230.1 hypothetical protein HMPREF0239_02641 [Clostridium sp. ATCC BAA-442]